MHDLDRLRAVLDGDLLTPDSPGYDVVRRPALVRYRDIRPLAVARSASIRDVARTIAYARDTGTHVVPRGGGHCFAGRSSTEGLVLDLGRLNAITVDVDGRATIGAGARLAQVYDALHQYGRTIPAGCGSTVGIAGLTLGGGLGLLGRMYGLTCDALVGAEVVLADGRLVDCDANRESELFWALRGAGGGQFGVVTSLIFATVFEPRTTRFELHWPDAAAAVIAAWQDWAPDAPEDITANLAVVAEPGRPLRVTAFGAALRDGETTSALLGELVAAAGIRAETRLREGMAFSELKRSFADDGAPVTTTSRSELFDRPLPATAIGALLDGITTGAPRERRELNFTVLGGAYNQVAADATAYVHRSQQFMLEHVADDGSQWVDRSWAIAHVHGSGRVYPNFPDPRLNGWAAAYHGGNLARLAAARHAYDPDPLFRFPQAI